MKRKIVKTRKDGVTQSYWKGDIEKLTEKNRYFRKVIFTGKDEQLVAMNIPVGEEIGNEAHPHLDQFFRVEKGKAWFIINNNERQFTLGPGGGAVIVAGTYHNVKNISKTPLLLYTVYSRPNHPKGQIDKTRMAAILREAKAHE